MKFEVIPDDIERGLPGCSSTCPIARSLCRGLGLRLHEVTIGDSAMSVQDKTHLRNVVLPKEVKNFIARFDRDYSVAPFSFELLFPGEITW